MPRVNRIKHARKPKVCGKCQAAINVGDPYVWFQFAYAAKTIRCGKPECYPASKELTRSEFAQNCIDYTERLDAACSALGSSEDADAFADELESLASDMREYAEELEERRGNMPEQLQDSDSGSLLEERAENLNNGAEELDEVATKAREVEMLTDTSQVREKFFDDMVAEGECHDPENMDDLIVTFGDDVPRDEYDSEEDWHTALKDECQESNDTALVARGEDYNQEIVDTLTDEATSVSFEG
jgi:hypothetical protein